MTLTYTSKSAAILKDGIERMKARQAAAVQYPYYEVDEATQRRFRMEAFVTGYRHGCMRSERSSPREATERFPHWANAQIEAYLNGQDDGIAGDHTRFAPIYDELHG